MSGAVLCKGCPDIKTNCTDSIDLKEESVSKWKYAKWENAKSDDLYILH